VHILGLACENHRIVNLARQYGLKVVEDAAEAMGVRYQGRHVGTFGDIGVLSFNGNKIITTGGGGMVITDNEEWGIRARYLSTQAKDDRVESIHNEVGYNYRLSNVQAALGLAQLEQLEEFIGKKRVIARAYEKGLGDLDRVTLMPTPRGVQPTYWLYSILLDEKATIVERKKLIQYLNENGIGARPFWHTIHDLRPYRSCQAFEIEHSVRFYERGVSLPCSVGLSAQDQLKCVEVLRQNLAK
jgi:perosamine synthetase